MTQLVDFELSLTAIDKPDGRRRWNGDPMPSREASAALTAAVDSFQAVVKALGFDVVRTGYGVLAREVQS